METKCCFFHSSTRSSAWREFLPFQCLSYVYFCVVVVVHYLSFFPFAFACCGCVLVVFVVAISLLYGVCNISSILSGSLNTVLHSHLFSSTLTYSIIVCNVSPLHTWKCPTVQCRRDNITEKLYTSILQIDRHYISIFIMSTDFPYFFLSLPFALAFLLSWFSLLLPLSLPISLLLARFLRSFVCCAHLGLRGFSTRFVRIAFDLTFENRTLFLWMINCIHTQMLPINSIFFPFYGRKIKKILCLLKELFLIQKTVWNNWKKRIILNENALNSLFHVFSYAEGTYTISAAPKNSYANVLSMWQRLAMLRNGVPMNTRCFFFSGYSLFRSFFSFITLFSLHRLRIRYDIIQPMCACISATKQSTWTYG